jgi:hypothetical protein
VRLAGFWVEALLSVWLALWGWSHARGPLLSNSPLCRLLLVSGSLLSVLFVPVLSGPAKGPFVPYLGWVSLQRSCLSDPCNPFFFFLHFSCDPCNTLLLLLLHTSAAQTFVPNCTTYASQGWNMVHSEVASWKTGECIISLNN